MDHESGSRSSDTDARVEKSLRRCLAWSQQGRYSKILNEVDDILPQVEDRPTLEASLLIWKAQALLAMGRAESALVPATLSWEIEPSPHACHLLSNALEALSDPEGAEDLLRMGWQLFPEAVHLPVQLAEILSGQGRLPEALDTLDEVPLDEDIPEDLLVFLFKLRSNLLATMGRWAEADDTLREGIDRHPDSQLLVEAHQSLSGARQRARAEGELAASWRESLRELDGVYGEVDESIIRCAAVNELSELVVLAARRLWRAFFERQSARPQAPDSWGTALVLAIIELDGERPSAAALARSAGCKPAGVRKVLARLRAFVTELDPEFSARAFAAHTNPRLNGAPATRRVGAGSADVVQFPQA